MDINIDAVATKASREYFWSILERKKYIIRIPIIQRDYVQGRKEDQPTQIRRVLIRDILNTLKNQTQMDINFIYGNVEKDTENNAEYFVPIDGQQRLTTLFLIHWYMAMWSGRMTPENRELLCRFKYETRVVTGDFCKRLVAEVEIDLKNLPAGEDSLIKIIEDYHWFFTAYENDASITAMLVMLQEIHNMVKDYDPSIVDSFFDTLISPTCPITFLFLNIDDVGLSDEIYIKMNARGKALTRFENFKAQLGAYLSKTDNAFSTRFIDCVNSKWSQFFWNKEYRPDVEILENGKKGTKKAVIFDDQIMKFFRFFMFNEYAVNVNLNESASVSKYVARNTLKTLDEENDFLFVNRLFTDGFREVDGYITKEVNVDEKVFRKIEKVLNVLSKRKEMTGSIEFVDRQIYSKSFLEEEMFFRRLIRSVKDKELPREDMVLLYAEYCYLEKYAESDYSFTQSTNLTEWIRFVYNLTRNTNYNNWEDYLRCVRRVRKLVDDGAAYNILDYAAKILRREYRQGSGYGFGESQMMEEAIKANLFDWGNEWKLAITEAEDSFLDTQISALLDFSGIWKMYEQDIAKYEKNNPNDTSLFFTSEILSKAGTETKYLDAFKCYLEKINMIFDKNSIKKEVEEHQLLRRALLTFGNEQSFLLPPGKSVCSFLDANDREYSFRRLLRDENKGKRLLFKNLLDSIVTDKDIAVQLTEIIANAAFNKKSQWKKYFVEMPEILECIDKGPRDPSGNYVFKNDKRFIYYKNPNQILLLEKTITSSTNREYYSYVLFLRARKLGLNVDYYATYSETAEKYVTYLSKSGSQIHVLYAQDVDSKFRFLARENGTYLHKGDMDNLLSYIEQTIASEI